MQALASITLFQTFDPYDFGLDPTSTPEEIFEEEIERYIAEDMSIALADSPFSISDINIEIIDSYEAEERIAYSNYERYEEEDY